MDIPFRVQGSFQIFIDGIKKAEFDNLILDTGLDGFANQLFLKTCSVGSGNSTPITNQTGLDAPISSVNFSSALNSASSAAPYYWSTTVTYNFPVGSATGNLREVGIGWSSSNLFSRALLLDASGNPTTLTVLSTESLQIQYVLKLIPNSADVVGSLLVNTTNCTLTTRASKVNLALSGSVGTTTTLISAAPTLTTYDTDISPDQTGEPSGGTNALSSSQITASYVAGSYYLATQFTFLTTASNFNIQSWVFKTGVGKWQTECNPYLPKDVTKTLTITMRLIWSR